MFTVNKMLNLHIQVQFNSLMRWYNLCVAIVSAWSPSASFIDFRLCVRVILSVDIYCGLQKKRTEMYAAEAFQDDEVSAQRIKL